MSRPVPPCSVAIIGADGLYQAVSEGWADLYTPIDDDDRSPSRWVGKSHAEVFGLSSHPEWRDAYQGAARGVDQPVMAALHVTLPGRRYPVSVLWALTALSNGAVALLVMSPHSPSDALSRAVRDWDLANGS